MKSTIRIAACFVALAVIPLLIAGSATASDEPWFNMGKCEACAPFMAEAGLMDHMDMSIHPIATGMVSIMATSAEYMEALNRAHAKCNAAVMRAQNGEEVYLCGMCTNILNLVEEGAKIDQLETKAGQIMTVTSSDPTMIKKIHAHVERTMDEMSKMHKAGKM